ncbi:hypothetical protein YB2330_001687 [Saitoella coloradoensis]
MAYETLQETRRSAWSRNPEPEIPNIFLQDDYNTAPGSVLWDEPRSFARQRTPSTESSYEAESNNRARRPRPLTLTSPRHIHRAYGADEHYDLPPSSLPRGAQSALLADSSIWSPQEYDVVQAGVRTSPSPAYGSQKHIRTASEPFHMHEGTFDRRDSILRSQSEEDEYALMGSSYGSQYGLDERRTYRHQIPLTPPNGRYDDHRSSWSARTPPAAPVYPGTPLATPPETTRFPRRQTSLNLSALRFTPIDAGAATDSLAAGVEAMNIHSRHRRAPSDASTAGSASSSLHNTFFDSASPWGTNWGERSLTLQTQLVPQQMPWGGNQQLTRTFTISPPPIVFDEKAANRAGINPDTCAMPAFARYFVIKSYSEDDIHKSLKYGIWASTEIGSKRLDRAFRESSDQGPIYLFFSVNASGMFCGVAQMVTPVDHRASNGIWAQDKWRGQFGIRWIFVKDIPNVVLKHIRVCNNDNKPVTNSRDTQELEAYAGREVLRTFALFQEKTGILSDWRAHVVRQRRASVASASASGGI